MKRYHKINSIFKRDEHKKFIMFDFSTPELDYLADTVWTFEEKLDGRNQRIGWFADGLLQFRGREDIKEEDDGTPPLLMGYMKRTFLFDKMKGVLPISADVCLYGEGIGVHTTKGGGRYLPNSNDFVLFDVTIDGWVLERKNVEDIAKKLGVLVSPVIGEGTPFDAIDIVKDGLKSVYGNFMAEGLVLRPKVQLFNRKGERIITKVKGKDFGIHEY